MAKSSTLIALGLVLAVTPALAEPRQERLHQNLNRSIQDQQQQQRIIQQNQFENNQMRQTIDRNNLYTPQRIVPGPGLDRR